MLPHMLRDRDYFIRSTPTQIYKIGSTQEAMSIQPLHVGHAVLKKQIACIQIMVRVRLKYFWVRVKLYSDFALLIVLHFTENFPTKY